MRKKVTQPINKILVQRADRMGDVILALPVIERLRVAYPDAQIDFLTSSLGAKVVDGHPHISQVKVVGGFFDTLSWMLGRRYDLFISLWSLGTYALLGWLARIPRRIGDGSNPLLAWMYTDKLLIPWANFSRHQVQFNLDHLQSLGLSDEPWITTMYPKSDLVEQVQIDYATSIENGQKIVFIFTDTGGSNLPIPESVLVAFVEQLCASGNFSVWIAYGQTRFPQLEQLSLKNLTNITTFISLDKLIAYISKAHVYIGPDTGPTHVASFLNIPLVYVTARKTNAPTKWGPLSDQFRIVRQEYTCPVFCSKMPCDQTRCLSYLSADLLMSEFISLMHQVESNSVYSDADKLVCLQKHTWRVAAVFQSEADYQLVRPVIDRLCREGLIVFPLLLSKTRPIYSFRAMLAICKFKNVTIFHGEWIPKWAYYCIRFLMGVIYLHYKPVWVRSSLSSTWSVHQFLECYSNRWNQEIW